MKRMELFRGEEMKLPDKVFITEVGPRDGFQNIKEWIPTSVKLEIIHKLIDAGFPKMEVSSFVNPKAIAQMQDAKDIVKAVLDRKKSCIPYVLVPNFTGAKIAYEAGIEHITYVFSVSESHNRENVRKTVEESLTELRKIKEQLSSLSIKVGLATAFECPFEGRIPPDKVMRNIEKCLNLDIEEICLSDTIGTADPKQTDDLINILKTKYPGYPFGFHFHDTRGMALANAVIVLQHGFVSLESSVGGLGGCPFAPGAAGNIASEDLINMLDKMDIQTGIDLTKVVEAAQIIQENIQPNLTGHLVNVCSR